MYYYTCNEGWRACAYQYADSEPPDVEDESRFMLMSKLPKRIIEWVSKAWTEFEKELPVFYREALARLLCLEHFRNLIETQPLDAGTTVYTDHAPSTYVGSLSNKERLGGSTRPPTLRGSYRPYGGLADPLQGRTVSWSRTIWGASRSPLSYATRRTVPQAGTPRTPGRVAAAAS